MVLFAATFIRLGRVILAQRHDPEFRALLFIFTLLLAGGTAFYASVEGWSVIDSLYFSVVTLSTVGYGDFAPRTSIGKVVTVFYLLSGIGVFAALVGKLAVSAAWRRNAPSAPGGEDHGSDPSGDEQN